VLHRDLKPANILIDDDGLVRITDFGIAIPRTDVGLHALTGTPAYMAPEQRMPGTPVSEQTDVYALGLVLYELLVGHEAFKRSGDTVQPPRPSTLVPNVDPRLERVIMQALSVDPRSRPSSVLDMATAIADTNDVSVRRRTGRPPTGTLTRGPRRPGGSPGPCSPPSSFFSSSVPRCSCPGGPDADRTGHDRSRRF
jgi:serine/threonine-protein kinase